MKCRFKHCKHSGKKYTKELHEDCYFEYLDKIKEMTKKKIRGAEIKARLKYIIKK